KSQGIFIKYINLQMYLLHKSSQQQVFNDEQTLNLPENYAIDWMKTLDDNKFISDIAIPGTHDSLALHGGPAAKCQAWSLVNQLKAGICYFDLRVSGDDLKVVHGPISQHTTFSDVVFVQKNSFHLGVPLHETDQHGDYKVGNVEKKKDKITDHLKEAIEACKTNHVVLNYSSGTGFPYLRVDKSPKSLAKEINLWLYNHLKDTYEKKIESCFGVIAMDFPGFDLIQMVINFNKQVGI
uniref:Phosphatidylinositol-specific phospholipase C X domain-containing protein n=1 Tax=Cyprinus carpio carpio TaxID=630221 RepID=A0A8C0Y7N0_CYPCA